MAGKQPGLSGIKSKPKQPEGIECLGQRFPDDAARREHFTNLLRERLSDPAFRALPGFPKGTDEDILKMSDPPYYTACPNPFLEEWVASKPQPAAVVPHREPFQSDISEGKNDPIYTAHTYHTKVPYKAIMRYILHYTSPGDLVFDGFAGTGMTGVAALACEKPSVEFRKELESAQPGIAWGARRCVLQDLAPIAGFISHNYVHLPDSQRFEPVFSTLLDAVERDVSPLYDAVGSARFCYGVWTDCFTCPHCSARFAIWDAAVDQATGEVSLEFPCPQCTASLAKADLQRVQEVVWDTSLAMPHTRGKYELSVVNVGEGRERVLRRPTAAELELAQRVEALPVPHWHPTVPYLFRDGAWGHMYRAGYHFGVSHVHHFFTKRNLHALADTWAKILSLPQEFRHPAMHVFTGTLLIASRMSRFRFDSRNPQNTAGGIMNGTLFVPSLSKEARVTDLLARRFESVKAQYSASAAWAPRGRDSCYVSTGSCARSGLPDASVDYVFTDPPFGSNIMYSELSFLWEAWLNVFTNSTDEAVVSDFDGKGLPEYQRLITDSFRECHRILKPGRWITVVFSNSKNSVWRAIQEALGVAGFIVGDIRTLDKKQGSFKQVTSTAVKQDLVISAYKPSAALLTQFELGSAPASSVWAFVREHLSNVPVFADHDGELEVVVERTAQTLHDRMIAFYVQRGVAVPISGPEFFEGLDQRFGKRDSMYFLPEQAAAYDKKRALGAKVKQLDLFVHDEDSSIRWLRAQLDAKPQSFQDLQPQFMPHVSHWAKHERTVELKELLEQNFLHYDGVGEVPAPIHSYLSSNLKLRNRDKSDPELRAEAKDRWYVPSAHRHADMVAMRNKALLREFQEYKAAPKKLKQFRTEAVRAGFKAAYDARDYRTIVEVAAKLPEQVVQEDEKLLMYLDVATTRLDTADAGTLFPGVS